MLELVTDHLSLRYASVGKDRFRQSSPSLPSAMSVPTLIRTSLVLIRLILIAALGQGAEHPGGDAGVGPHADAHDRELGQRRLDRDLADAGRPGDASAARLGGVAGDRERQERIAVAADVLDDHIDEHAGLGDPRKTAGGVARAGRERRTERDPGLRLVELDARR